MTPRRARCAIIFPLLLLSGLAAAMPRLEMEVRLDPATRQFGATAVLADDRDLPGFRLGPEFEITALTVNGQSLPPARRPASAAFRLPPGARRVELAYRATLAATPRLDHRQALGQRAATAAPEGSFLPGAALWYPDVGQRFGYRLVLRLPAGQKGLVPGNLVEESDTAAGYRAAFDFPYPADGIDLIAGPYGVSERSLKLASDRTISIRTWFHEELAPLAQGYLDDSARYIERYSRLIGDYPFEMFSVVSSPTPTGFGMPSLTYLGREVLKLPFIRATSLGHEVLHNWWGNGVYPDWRQGNWSEGLTTFLADYAYKEDEGEEAAREMRLGWLRDLAAVRVGDDGALKDFTARHHGIASIVGYNKAAMVFLMLRDEIGQAAFERGLRLLWERKRFQTASWADLEAAFSDASGRTLGDFFRQWVARPGAPDLHLKAAEQAGDTLTLHLARPAGYMLGVPLRLTFADRSEAHVARLSKGAARIALKVAGAVRSVEADPDYRLWRRVDPALLPPILREVFVAPGAGVVVIAADPAVHAAAHALAARALDARPLAVATAWPASGAMLVVGLGQTVDAWLAQHGLAARPAEVGGRGSAQVWAGRDDRGRPYAVIAARDVPALKALERGLPHYGRQGWLVFEGARVLEKGSGAPQRQVVQVAAHPAR